MEAGRDSLPQTAIRVIQLPNLGSLPQTAIRVIQLPNLGSQDDMKFLCALFYWAGVILMGAFSILAILFALIGGLIGHLIGRCKRICVR